MDRPGNLGGSDSWGDPGRWPLPCPACTHTLDPPRQRRYPAGGTIFDRLDAHGISWKDYYTNLATPELFPPLYLKNLGTKIVPIAGFFTDAAAGTLPGYCLVEPEYGTADEENPQNIARGEAFATPPPLAAPLLDTDPGALACDTSGPGVIPPPGSVTGPAAETST